MRRSAAALLALGSLLAGPPALGNATEPPAPRSMRELRGMLREALEGGKTPGVGWAVVTAGGGVEAGGSGWADVASKRRATGDTLFRIGSISKMFAAITVLQLVEEGKLSLDDRLAERAPDVAFKNPWEATDPVRIANLLEHTAGFDDLSFAEYAHSVEPPLTLAQGLAFRPASRTSRWRPGTRQAYCNSGPAMAARVVEEVTGRRFEDVVAERVFAPLGMTSATYFRPLPEEAATLYHSDGVTPFPYWEVIVRPAGSVNASAREMAAVVEMLLGRGTYRGHRVLSPESVERMEHPATTTAARAGLREGYGLADYVTTVGGFLVRGHNGGMGGALARLGYLPDQHVGFVFMINSDDAALFDRIEKLFVAALTLGVPRPAIPPAVAVPPAVASRFTGWYEPASARRQDRAFFERVAGVQHVTFGKATLNVRGVFDKGTALRAVTPTLFRAEDDPTARVALVDDPRDGTLVTGSDTVRRIPAWLALGRLGAAVLALLLLASAPLVALAWVPQRLLRRSLRGRRRLGVLLWPAAAAVIIVCIPALLALAGEDAVLRIGLFTPLSAGLFMLTGLAPFAALGSAVVAFRRRPDGVARVTAVYARAVACGALVCALGLVVGGWFAVRTWV
ncbi:MAG TPA: serine hydrolase domain-containing protein [Thermoanaerobaculaceae bacterium]|nr:serine hydrolase domain-containing protein [Thermoanaerobaculaceae bacterium]